MKRLIASILFILPLTLFAQAPEVEITAEPSHHLALTNEYLRVFQVEVAPHASTLMHRHRHDYMFVTLGDSHVSNQVAGKTPVDLKIADGETHYTPGNFAHIAVNLSDQPFRNVTIEFLQDEQLRNAPSPWPANSGPHDTTGVHAKVLFEKDGARVSQIEIDPGTTVPHHHEGPHLMVAANDLELSSDVEGRGSMPAHFKSGDVKWLPGGYTHTLTNTGKSAAKLVIVEFADGKTVSSSK
jgi:quercetin dioxygenase-like cupin family protein